MRMIPHSCANIFFEANKKTRFKIFLSGQSLRKSPQSETQIQREKQRRIPQGDQII